MTEAVAIAILGMHRSGTSALAGSLRQAGVYLGDVLEASIQYNKKGLNEPRAILYMHEDLLVKSGGAWHDPPEAIEWGPLHTAVRDLFIESRRGHSIWGFKDPRTVLVLEGWLNVLPDLKCAGIFRHPHEVAQSLESRNGFDLEKGYRIWFRYNQRLLSHAQNRSFPIIEYGGSASDFNDRIMRAIQILGIQTVAPPDFFDPSLKHNSISSAVAPLPSNVAALYDHLCHLAI